MKSPVATPKMSTKVSSRKLIMEYCPTCQASTAFEFDSETAHSVSCLNCGSAKTYTESTLDAEPTE